MNQIVVVKQSHRFASKTFDVHCFSGNKMLDSSNNLRWTTVKIRAIMIGFAFAAN